MIDFENVILTTVRTNLLQEFPKVEVTSTFERNPSHFPTVSVVEADNTTDPRTVDSGSKENRVRVMYEVQVWTNNAAGKKQQGKKIFKSVSDTLVSLGLYRTMSRPFMGVDDDAVYRHIGRFTGFISTDGKVYGR